MKYMKLFEKIEIGTYAILRGPDTSPWNNWYGIVISEVEPGQIYKIKILNEITEDDKIEMKDYLRGTLMNAHKSNFRCYQSKSKFDEEVEIIETKRALKKYNL